MIQPTETPFDKKYVPTVFSELVGVDHLRTTLQGMIRRRSIGNVMFIGPNGYGKTTTAKVFMKAISCARPNGLDACGTCDSCRTFGRIELTVDYIDTCGTELASELPGIASRQCLVGLTFYYRALFVDDLDGAENGTLFRFKDHMNRMPNNSFIATVSDINKLPNPLKERFTPLRLRSLAENVEAGHRLIHRICANESIAVKELSAIDALIHSAAGNRRLVIRALELLKFEGTGLSEGGLKSQTLTDFFSYSAGTYSGCIQDEEDEE